MDRETVTALIKTRLFEPDGDEMTLIRDHAIRFGEDIAHLRIEYKPEKYRLTEDALDPLADEDVFEPSMEIEELVSVMYWSLVDTLYPAHSYLDEPWDTLPLVVEASYEREDHSAYVTSMGRFR